MGSPNIVLDTPESNAAISRFFYNPTPEIAPNPDYDRASPWAFSSYFHQRYNDLLSGQSMVAELAIGQDGRSAPYETAGFEPRAVVQLGFDIGQQDHGIYGWQISVTEPSKNPLGPGKNAAEASTATKRTVAALYTMARASIAGVRQYDQQGRSIAGLGVSSGEGWADPSQVFGILYGLVDFAELDGRAKGMGLAKTKAEEDIAKYSLERQGRETDQYRARLKEMENALARIAFVPTHFKIKLDPKTDLKLVPEQ